MRGGSGAEGAVRIRNQGKEEEEGLAYLTHASSYHFSHTTRVIVSHTCTPDDYTLQHRVLLVWDLVQAAFFPCTLFPNLDVYTRPSFPHLSRSLVSTCLLTYPPLYALNCLPLFLLSFLLTNSSYLLVLILSSSPCLRFLILSCTRFTSFVLFITCIRLLTSRLRL